MKTLKPTYRVDAKLRAGHRLVLSLTRSGPDVDTVDQDFAG
jgi:hypothetical protein